MALVMTQNSRLVRRTHAARSSATSAWPGAPAPAATPATTLARRVTEIETTGRPELGLQAPLRPVRDRRSGHGCHRASHGRCRRPRGFFLSTATGSVSNAPPACSRDSPVARASACVPRRATASVEPIRARTLSSRRDAGFDQGRGVVGKARLVAQDLGLEPISDREGGPRGEESARGVRRLVEPPAAPVQDREIG